jgi:hypothetical protein
MSAALGEAWDQLTEDQRTAEAREALARAILRLADDDESEPVDLSRDALRAIQIERPDEARRVRGSKH